MSNLFENRQLWLLKQRTKRPERKGLSELEKRLLGYLINVLGAIFGVAICVFWFWLYWYVCP